MTHQSKKNPADGGDEFSLLLNEPSKAVMNGDAKREKQGNHQELSIWKDEPQFPIKTIIQCTLDTSEGLKMPSRLYELHSNLGKITQAHRNDLSRGFAISFSCLKLEFQFYYLCFSWPVHAAACLESWFMVGVNPRMIRWISILSSISPAYKSHLAESQGFWLRRTSLLFSWQRWWYLVSTTNPCHLLYRFPSQFSSLSTAFISLSIDCEALLYWFYSFIWSWYHLLVLLSTNTDTILWRENQKHRCLSIFELTNYNTKKLLLPYACLNGEG